MILADCIFILVCALLFTVVIAILRENHELRKTIAQLEISRQNLFIQIRLDAETIARGEALNQSLKARVFELKDQLQERNP